MNLSSFIKFATFVIVALAPLDAMADGGPAKTQSACEQKYEASRVQLMKMLGTERGHVDVQDEEKSRYAIDNVLCSDSRKLGDAPFQACRASYLKVRQAVLSAENSSKQACAIMDDATATQTSCAKGQSDCFRSASEKFRKAAAKLAEAKSFVTKGVKEATKIQSTSDETSRRLSVELRLAADAMTVMEKRMALDPLYAAQVGARVFSGERKMSIAVSDTPFFTDPNARAETVKVLATAKVNADSSEHLRNASEKIDRSLAAKSDITGGNSDLHTSGFGTADEMVQARTLTNRFTTVGPKFEQELGASELKLKNYASDMDRSAKGLSPLPHNDPVSQAAGGGGSTPSNAGSAPSSAEGHASTDGYGMPVPAFSPERAEATGSSRSQTFPTGGTAVPNPLRAANVPGNSTALPATSATANVASSTVPDSAAAPTSPQSPVAALAATGGPSHDAAPYSATTDGQLPSFAGQLATAAATTAPVIKTADTAATLEAGAKALQDPQVKSIVDLEMARLGSRAPASASLRERLRQRLAASVAGKLEAARAKNDGAANGPMASLLNEARARNDRAAYEKSFELGSAETDLEVSRLMGKRDSEQLSEIPGAFSTLSLFERVHSAHTRFWKNGAKPSPEVLSRNP